MADREEKTPQLNIRPGVDLYGRLAVLAAVNGLSAPEQARAILAESIDRAFEENPALVIAHDAIELARRALNDS